MPQVIFISKGEVQMAKIEFSESHFAASRLHVEVVLHHILRRYDAIKFASNNVYLHHHIVSQ